MWVVDSNYAACRGLTNTYQSSYFRACAHRIATIPSTCHKETMTCSTILISGVVVTCRTHYQGLLQSLV